MAACAAIFAATVAHAQMDPVAREPLIAPGVSVPRPPGSIPGVAVSGPAPVAAPPVRKQRSYPDSRSAMR
ncbi:MAG: hypothetical protein ACRCYS_19735, partial [Beijerinckiaceae bacterium]